MKKGKMLEREAWLHFCQSAEIGISRAHAETRLEKARTLIRAEGERIFTAYLQQK